MRLVDKVKASVLHKFAGEDSKERQVKPAAVEHTVQHVIKEQVQPVHVEELRLVEVKHLVQPIEQHEQEEATEHAPDAEPVTFEEVLHEPTQQTARDRQEAEAALAAIGKHETLPDVRETVQLEPVRTDLVTHHLLEVVQPVIRKHTTVPHNITHISPSFTRHVHVQLHNGGKAEVLPVMSQREWQESKAHEPNKSKRTD